MKFSEVIGNAEVAKALVSMADSGRVAHAMLMYENEGCGALALALAYVQYLNCKNRHDGDSCGECPSCRQMAKLIHPDVHFIFPVNKGPKSPDDKPTSESYLPYWRELASANPYFVEADLQRTIGIESKTGLIAVAEAKNIISKLSLMTASFAELASPRSCFVSRAIAFLPLSFILRKPFLSMYSRWNFVKS